MPPVFLSTNSTAVGARLAQGDAAASRVLEAERAALAGVEQCKREALHLVSEARTRADWIHERTESRIERLLGHMEATARRRQERIRGEVAALAQDAGADSSVLANLDAAIALIVAELTGGPESVTEREDVPKGDFSVTRNQERQGGPARASLERSLTK
jgi:vacuolar-type H+-ATPase subunit H